MTLDLNMPDMHGMEVLRFVRSHQTYRHIPIIVLTTKGDPVSQTAAMEAGASLYLTKPFMPGFLSARTLEFLLRTILKLTGKNPFRSPFRP